MSEESIGNARYVKLGTGGKWAVSSIKEGKLRFGWREIPLGEIRAADRAAIRARLTTSDVAKGKVTSDIRTLLDLVTSTPDDVWITFHGSHLWWGRLSLDPIQEDEVSRYRTLVEGWRCKDTTGGLLTLDRVPGVIAQLQGFRGTVCAVGDAAALKRLINSEPSEGYQRLAASNRQVIKDLQAAIPGLHWKDFEVLVDLIFRQAGWRRRSMLGESMKFVDLELVEPITGEAYQVQVKAKAGAKEFEEYATSFKRGSYRRLYFVVHTPSPELAGLQNSYRDVELVLPERLAELVADGGLVGWVLDKVR